MNVYDEPMAWNMCPVYFWMTVIGLSIIAIVLVHYLDD